MTRVCMIVFKNDVPVLSAYFSLLFSLLPSTKRKHVAAVTILRPKKKKKTQTRATKIIMSSSSPATENDERLREFVLWCQQRGCELNKVEIKSVDAYKVKTPKGHSIDEDAEKEFDRRVHCGERTSSSGRRRRPPLPFKKASASCSFHFHVASERKVYALVLVVNRYLPLSKRRRQNG